MLERLSRLLVVDDSAAVRKVICGMLKSMSYCNADQAPDGRTALSMLTENHYELVISDWNMGPGNGLKLLQELRKRRSMSFLPFVMITVHKTDFSPIVREEDAFVCVKKPFGIEGLSAAILRTTTRVAA